ncbi:MAG: hypothetical protein FJZ16_06885, partial [Candidatus Omnitrophica bacterium]|nr:hypothetical protein [Candidatus Omnitrophota bacterium]
MKSNTSPEEKLLRLIKGQKRQDAIGMDNKSPLKVANSQPKIKHSVYSLTQRYLSFLGIRRIVSFALVVSCIYLAISFIYPFVGLNKIKLPQITLKENTNELKMEPAFDMKPYESYLQEIRKRQIFSSVPIQEMEKPVSGVNLDLIKDISL